uniref:Dystonin n=1 Tax=Oncorhynchus tshawytscha TaxID=74940 RepID=A0A8C8ESR7_ONCTS
MIAAAFLVLLRPYSIQVVLLLLLLLLGTIATILFFCCWHRRLRNGKHPIKSVLSGRSRSRGEHSPRHARRARARVAEEKPLVEIPQSDHQSDSSTTVRKRKVKKRVLPDFYHSVQVTPTRKPSSGSGNASLHCSMSSSADFSDEDDYSLKSGSVSPAPGDTLPWNLPRHERHKRQIQGGSVLDPAERAVLRIADERDRVQKKTFTKWINQHLLKVRKHVNDLYEDLRDGHNLISLLEVLTGQSLPRERDFLKTLRLPREKGRMRFHRLQNVQIALDFLKRRQVKLVNIRNDDITDGNPKLTLGLIWTIILHFQISEIHVCGESEDMTAKERLLMWSQQMTEGYVGVRCDNFTSSWRDGRLFNAIIHKYRPDLVDMARVSAQTSRSNLEQAFGVAERLGVARLLDPEDVDVQTPDEKSVITYVSTLYDVFPKVPDGVDGINANDVDIKWVEYQNMVNYLSQWLKHNVAVMSDRAFPNNPVELKALYTQYLQFKENEIPLKETEKSKIKHLYKMLEVWIEFGRIQLPQGYHPNDVEKEWGKLIVAMLEREKSLRPEVDRLEMLQQIASRVQRDCVNGEDKLELARAALQSDAKRLESGVQFQNEAETAGYLLECENLLRQQVVDIQILLDGKYYYSDQLVQRVSKLRDDLLGLRAECSSVYRQGRTLTPQQTTMMISGITQSLNSGFSSSNLNSSLTPGGVGMAPGDLQHLKHMQIRKPLCKTSLADPNMTEDEVNINFVQDLINWVEEMQVQLDRGDWGSDLPSVETHLENHKGVHRAIEEFQMSLKEAKLSETQMNQKLSYSEKLGKLETQYGKLLNCSRERQKNLESLHDFVSRATMELIWLNEKEEEEVAFDWSDLNGNISKKRQYHSDLMRELDEKEEVIKSVQDRAENLLQENHPARLTLEAYKAAMQTQWSWILQLCSCVEQHLKDNTVYFEFLNNAKESTDYLKSLQGDIQRKYGCDRTSSVHKLEDHIQESMDEKEQLLQYRSTVAGLVGKAKAIVQLKPRNPDTPVRSSIPVKAICDYRQIEITIYKDDECVLASNSHRAKWKVISPSGNEAMVPSVCFTVPPPNKEAVDQASRIEQLYQNVLALWHHSHIKMKSVVSWHYLMADVRAVRDWNVSSIKTMLPGEHQQVLSNLQSHFEDFLEDSKESEVFTVADCSQLEREVLACKDYYEELLKSAEREEHEESVYNLYISEVRNFRMRLEAQEEHLIRQIRTPLDRDDLEQSVLRITEQEKKKAELDQLKDDLETMKEKCETFFRQAGASPAVPTLSSDLNVLIHSMSQVYSMSAIYLEKLKTVSMVVRHSQSAEALVKLYEAKLSEEDAVNSDLKSIDTVVSTLKQWRSEIDEQREIFHDLEDGLQKARGISERMFKAHNERDFDLDWHKEKADQLEERWSNVHSQIESRLDYELQLLTYRAMVDSQHKSPLKRRRMQNSADAIIQEFMDLRTRYTAVVTSMTQYVKFASETLKRAEGEERSVDEEKKEHGDKVSKLLNWMSSVKPGQNKDGKASTEASSKPQVSMEEMVTQKEKIAEALRTTQLMLSKHSDKMTEEEKLEAKEQLKSLHQAYSDLTQQCSDQTPSAEQEFQTIEGVLEVGSIEVYSVFSSVQSGMIDHTTGLSLLEAQLITSGLVLPQFRMCLELDEAFHHNLIDEATWKQLRELNEANRSILSPPFSSEPLPVMAALREGAVSERLAMKVIEIQLATGGLRVSYTGDVLTLERAFQFGLIPAPLYVKLLERQNTWKDLINPGTAEKVSLTQLVQRSVVDEETGLRLLPVKKSHNGSIELTSGREMSVLRAVHEGLIDRETTLRLLGAQLFAGGIADPKTGRKLTVEQALSEGLIDQDTASGILSQQAQNGGIVNPQNGKRLTVDEAVQCDLMSFSSALLVLEKQKGLMGLLWPHSGEILTVSTSLRHEIITSQLAFKLLSNRQKIASLYIPEYSEVVDINSATQNGLIDVHTAEVLKTIEIPDVFPDVDDLNDRFSNWLMLRELQIGGSHRSTDDNEIDYENINTPSSIEAKQLFISYLTMNSYMDPKSGQRLLIFDGQLTKMAELLHNSVSSDGPSPFEIGLETSDKALYNQSIGESATHAMSESSTRTKSCSVSGKDISLLAQRVTDEASVAVHSEKNARQPDSKDNVLSNSTYQKTRHSTNPSSFEIGVETSEIPSDYQSQETVNGVSASETVLEKVVWDNTDERGLATHLLRPQVEEGGILYIISEKRCDLDSPFDKGLVDEETVLEVSALQLHKGDVLEEERSTVATLKEVVSESSISSQIALQTMEQHSMLGGVHDPKSGCTISVSAALDSAMIDDDLAEKILHSDPVHKAIIHPDRHCTHSMSYSQSLGLIDNDEAENLRQHQTDKKLSVLVLDDSDEEEWIENTDGHAREDLYTEGSKEQNCDSQKALLPSFTISHGPVCRQIISPILSDQVTEGRVIHELETTSSFREDSASHSPTSPLSDIVPGSRNSIQNDILSNRSNSLSLSDSGDSGAPQRQAEELRQTEEDGSSSLRRDTDLSCEAVGFTPGDGQLGAGYREIVGDQTVSPVQSDSGVSCSSHSDLLSDERKMENTVQAPASQLVKESDRRIDSSSPRDLSGDVTSTVSGDVGVSGDKTVINGDGVSSFNTVSPQRPLVKSERDVGGEIELTSSQNGHSHSKPTVQKKTPVQLTNLSDLAIVSSVHSIKSGNDNKDSYDIGDQEQLETAPIKEISSTITPDPTLTDKRLPNSNANVEAKANDRVESSRSGDSKPGRQEGSSDDGLSQITDQATSQTGQTSSNDTSLLSASTMTPGNPSKAKEPGMRSDGKQDECGSVENHPQPMATNAQPDSHSNTPSTSEMTSGHPVKPGLGSEHTCRQNQCGAVGNHPHLMTVDVPPDSMTHDSVPPPALAIYTALRTGLDELVRMRVEGADVDDLQKAETQAVEDIINLIQVIPQSHGRGFGEETDAALGLMISSSPDLLRDLLKQEPLRSGKTSPAEEEGEPLHEETPPSDVTQIQSRLLQVLQSVSSSQDPAMLRDVIGTLSSILGGAPHEDRPHSLEILQEESSSDEAEGAVQQYSTQDYLECVGRLQDHADVLEEIMNVLSSQQGSLSNNMEELHSHLDESQSLEAHLSTLAGFLTRDLDITKQLLKSASELVPTHIHQDLASAFRELQPVFADVCQMSAEKNYVLRQAIDTGKAQLKSTYQDLLSTLDRLSGCIHDNSEMACNLDILNPSDVDTVKDMIQKNKGMETNLSGTHRHLEDTAFDIQYFISEHAQFLSPTQSRHLLKSLSATQREFKEQMERVAKQRRTLERHLEIREDESQQKEKQKVFSDKLQELCDNLTNTENRLIGHQQQTKGAASVEDLQHVQQEHQALQKDILTNGSALNEVISSSKKFLDENRSKLTPDQIIAIESKLEDAKSKVKLINQRAEEARKDLEKSVTTAIKQETEKEAAVEQLEESKNKIEGLLDWINNMGNEKVMGGEQTDHMGIQNGNMPLQSETSAKNILGEDDDPNGNNGNAFQTTDNDTEGQATGKTPELDLEKQYDRVKARHQEILSQQQELIMATQSAQALLDHQAHALSPTDKDKLQRDIQELKGRYDSSLTQAEQQMKQMVQVQEELKKFQGDCEEFEGWLQQAEGEVEELGAPAGALNDLTEKLRRQKSFSDDVISHKGDLRFITISGQKVLDVAKACGRMDPGGKDAQLEVDTTATCAAVKEKLDSAAGRFKALHSQCNDLGNNLRDVVDKYKKYEDSAAGLLKWLNNSEEDARRQQSEAIAADPQTLQKQLEDTKGLQGQTTGRQTAVETLRKTADSLVTAQGDLLTNQDHIHETVDDIVERYDNLSKSVSDRNEKLQITLTRSLSVQDGLDEMMSWMEGVEESVKEKGQVPLDSAVIGDVLSKEAALEQDISSRQSSISAMKAKVKKFVETADPAAAALLQSKMDALSQRFSDACDKHKHKQGQLEQLKDKVEEFEKTTEKVQQFVLKRSQALSETDGPGKNVNELSQLMQDTNTELAEHAKDVEMLQMLSKELANMGPEGSKAQIQSKMDKLSDTFNTFKNTVKEKEEEVTSCQDQLGDFRAAAGALRTWLEETTEKVPVVQPTSSEQSLGKDLQRVNALMEEWTTKGSAVQDINSKGSALCSLISVLTSPAKTKMSHKSAVTNSDGPGNHAYLTNKELMVVQQNMSYINEGHKSLGEVLKGRATELSVLVQEVTEAQKETDTMITWLQDMKKTAASWNSASTEKDTMKTQLEQQKAFEEDMKQKHEQLQKLREKLLHLIEKHPDSPEAEKWKQMLSQIDTAWADVSGSVEDRKQRLEESNRNLDVFQTTEPQLRQWLSEKDMMLSVLGPLSMDPNMLNTQKQQVQILLNEFDSRKPQFDQLHEAAAAILSTSGKQDPSSGGKVVKDQLAAVTQKWQGLTGQLGQRAGLIDQAVGKSSQFQDLLMSLSQSAASLETRLNSQQALSSQPDVVKKQLEEANTISGQLREERKRLKEAETLCSELSALVTEDYLKAGLDRQLEGVNKPFKQLEDKAGKRIQQLNSAFASSQQFHQASKDFQGWMNGKLQEQSKLQAISAQVETLRQSLKEQSALQKALSEHEEPYSTIVREGETLLQNTDGAEKVAMQGQLATLRSNWDDVKKSSAERQDKLQGALQRAQKYHEHAEKLQSWVQECEVREGSVRLSVDPAEVESSISQLKAIQKDVDKHRGLVEQLNTAADSLLEVANADTEAVREEKAAIGQSVDRVTDGVQNKRESLEKISQRLKEFNDTHNEAKGQLAGAKKQLDAHTSLGVQAYSNKNLTNMKAQQKSLDGVNTQVEHLKSLAQGLVADVPEADGVTDLLLQADSLEKEHGSLSKDVGETCSTLEGKLQGIGQFQTNIREMFTRFADLDDELDSMASVGRDLITLKEQQDGIKGFVEKLQGLMADTARGGDSCKKMLETEASPDLLGLKRDLDGLSKQCGKLMDRAKGRGEEVGSTLTRLDELYSKLQQFTNKLGGAEVKEEGQGSVGMETDVINQQLEAFKVFQKEVDPLQSQLQDINWLGQGLIQNADKGTSTKGLEHDLEDVNTRWNTLNKKIAERSVQLHEALLHCGRFQDALESLLSWLTDTEDLVSNQKPPSAEFKVVKAQIQEQILLQRLLDDRRPTVELIKKEGGKVAELGAESVDKEKVGKEIDCLGQRWDALLKKAENRHKQLKSILVVAQQFHETLEPLSEWLSATEKHLAKAEPIGTQTSKLEEQISQHKVLEEEITGHCKDLVQAVNLGQMLKLVSSVDDKELVQSKLDSSQASYVELQERCRRKAEMLQQALANAQLFGEDEVALMNWLNEVHTRLSEVSVKDYKTDVLEKQCAEQLALHEDIELRKQNVDQAISNGLELLKQTTGDEVVVIQGKLDGIKTRYAEINSMSGNVSQTLNQALTLASKLQHTHEDLSSWLENVEAELTAFAAQAPVGEQLVQAQDRQKALLQEARDHKPQVDKLNEVSSSLLELVPWRAREGLDKIVTEDNDRYKATSDTIAHHAEQIDAAILKSQQFEQAADTELAWLTEAERKMLSLGEIRLEQDQTTVQLLSQKGFSMDIMRHKDAVDGIVKTGEAIMNSKDEEEKQALKAKIQALLEKYVVVSQLNSERCLQLERAQSLASQFWETYEELWPWLQETRTSFSQLPLASIEYEALRQQQEELRQMRELIAEHKPYIDKMNKTGPQLLELSPVAGVAIREKYTATDLLYAQLKADVKQRAFTLDEAISKSTQFHDKIEPMLESLERIAERLHQPPSISVEVEKIREQITENKVVSADLEKLQPSYDTLKQRGEEMIARSAGADKDISAKAVQDKLDRMVFTWNEIHALMEEREAKLLDVMDLADKFWCDHCALIVTIKDTQDLLRELEEPGVDPSVVKQQQEYLESFKEEIDGLQEELDVVRNLGAELMAACGEPDKPVTKKSIDEVNLAWETLNKAWKERVDRLDEAMQAAVQFQDGLQVHYCSLWINCSALSNIRTCSVGHTIFEFKGEAYQLQMEMERLNHQAGLLLKKVTEEYDRCAIQEPMTELKMLWDNLDEKIINRQHKLEGALLALGQFQHALDELLAWMSNTEELLNEQRKAVGDPKAIEIKLAKHHVLQNDVLAHKTTVEAVNKAGTDLVESTSGEEAAGLQNKLENLTQRWKNILEKTEQRRQQLDSALLQAQGFHGEMEDMQQWLKDTERQLLASKAVGGLPDTAREQLNAHLELCSTMEAKEELYQQLMNKGQQLLTMTPSGQDSNTEQDLRNLQDKWESVQAKVAERKVKLEEALALATEFHNSLQDFISWLTQAEQTLTMSSPASVILETILFQIDEHKVFVTEVNSHRQQIIELDKTGTHLKYFSQKQDVVLIKNLLISVQGRWEKVVQRSVERGRLLDDTRKRAKQFHETWNKLTEWLDDSEKALDSELEIANDPDKIKTQLAQHKEFQKVLGSKHSVYDTTSRTGRALKDKTSLQDDNQKLDDMLSELRDKWDTVCGKSVERQNKLEEALLFSGQFTDALQALIDWLYRVEPQLAEDQPVHGDIDLVLNLIDSHKVFQKELGKRTGSVAALKRSAKDLIESSHEDSSWVKAQMQELSARWETVCARSVSKQTRLEQALCQAEEFHSTVHMLLEWLAEAEQSLRFHGTLPDDEEALGALIEQHKEFMKKQEEKRVGLNKATSMGEAILTICHPDSITTIKHWNTIIKARFEEVQAWARQHQQRLAMALSDLLATKDLLEGLLGWLQWAETTLNDKDKEVIPQEIDEVKSLIAEHQTFMEEMTRKQPDVDKVTKTHKRKAVVGSEPASQSHIPVLEKGRGGRKRSPTQAMYPSSQPPIETKNPRVNLLVSKWQQVWLLALDRRRKLNDAMDRLEELKEFANFDFDVWRKRYMRWMNHKKSRVMDFFRRIDKDQDGKVTRQEFIEGILSSKFPTSRLEMSAVADIFDRDGDGYIDYYEFVAALHPNKEAYKPLTDADKIEDEVTRQVAKCKCPKRFQVEQIGANKYRFYLGNQFGDSQQLRLVRILRSTVMVRVGGGWMALDEFLVKNDPCRAKGRTNMELREKFILPEGTTQVMASFRYRGRRSRPSSRAASPNRSNSNHSCPAQHNNPALTSTPKTPQHITRNYDKPWLTNSKPSSPLKSSDSFESQGSSSESIPIQGSKLRLPGYLSGKGFQSGEEQGTLINAAVMKARGQAIGFESRRPGSRPGSKAGSRGSSRRGSDASDFDISDIASVCSETSEMVGDTSRATPRSSSRQHGGKPSKIPTPQRRLTPSKLAKTSKR